MAIKIPERNYFTFAELQKLWKCTEDDLKFAIISSEIKPSIMLLGEHKVISWEVDPGGEWRAKNPLPLGKGFQLQVETKHWQYLQDPVQIGAFECEFSFLTNDRDAEKEEGGNSFWRRLPSPIRMEQIKEAAVFLLEEVARYESRYGGNSVATDVEKPLKSRERGTLLNIIGALLELIKSPREGRDSNAAVITELVENYDDKPGISKPTLENTFAEARRQLELH